MTNDIIKLYKEGQKLVLLEIAYFSLTVISFGLAGIVALFNQSLGVSILIVPLVTLVAGVMNIIAWSLVKLVLEHLVASKNEKTIAKASKTTKKISEFD